jgi:vacuolar-type H+-ATPase subunit E/Vma4
VRKALDGRRDLQVEAAPVGGGVVVRATDGSWSVDATFGSRLQRAWPRLAIALARHLEERP